jgi:hypothetical protein
MPRNHQLSSAELRDTMLTAIRSAEHALARPRPELFQAAGEALDALNDAVDLIDDVRLQAFEVSRAEERELSEMVLCIQALIVLLLREVERPLARTSRSRRPSAPARPSWDLN